MNMAGENFVRTILNHPNAMFIRQNVDNIDFYHIVVKVPKLGGLNFDINGNLKGFLNP